MTDAVRITSLPTRALAMNADLMEFAYQDDQAIYLVSYTPRSGAPDDPTKREFDVMLDVFTLDGGLISPTTRTTTHTIYNDPSGAVGTPGTSTPANQILGYVTDLVARARPWAAQLLDPTPLYEQLLPSAPASSS